LPKETRPASTRVITPQKDAIRQLTAAMPKNLITSNKRSGLVVPTTRFIRKAAKSACRVDPVAMLEANTAVAAESVMLWVKNQMFALKEPNQMPNPLRYPNTSAAASARPEGGHTDVTLPGGMATKNPSFAVAT
jgi:hypothetical protein